MYSYSISQVQTAENVFYLCDYEWKLIMGIRELHQICDKSYFELYWLTFCLLFEWNLSKSAKHSLNTPWAAVISGGKENIWTVESQGELLQHKTYTDIVYGTVNRWALWHRGTIWYSYTQGTLGSSYTCRDPYICSSTYSWKEKFY